MKQFRIRASACGKIMINDRSGKIMGQTAMSYCEMWLKEQIYNRHNEFSSKYTEKGNVCEDNSLDFIAEQLNYGMLIKNDRFVSNDFAQGTPDVILKNEIIDVKNSWDWSTFPLFENEIPNKDYFWQLQTYMFLCEKEKAKLIYVLSDTPEHLIEREAFFYCRNNGYSDVDVEIYEEFKAKMTYPDIAPENKIKVFEINRDETVIEAIKKRVEECRNFIVTLIKK